MRWRNFSELNFISTLPCLKYNCRAVMADEALVGIADAIIMMTGIMLS